MRISDQEKVPDNPVLKPKDVQQVCFLLEQTGDLSIEDDGRLIIGQLSIGWRGAMGNRGYLATGSLATRQR